MALELTPIGPQGVLIDDPAIADADILVRYIRTEMQVTMDYSTGSYILSDQSFKAKGRGVSVELERKYSAEETVEARCAVEPMPFGAVSATAGFFRKFKCINEKGKETKESFGICYTPEQPNGLNPLHCDIHPKPTPSVCKKWNAGVTMRVALDQDRIVAAKAARKLPYE